ncbi:hypothetical protein HA075_18930 [bacterium BFN5]|nr:hypothetical protein HA075_18930 [bacterium BFN5]
MKRIALILFLMVLLTRAVASAEIRHEEDKIANRTTVRSDNYVSESVDFISLMKTVTSNSAQFKIVAEKRTIKDFAFTKTFIEIQIDEHPVHVLEVGDISTTPTVSSVLFWFSVEVPVPQDIINELKTAKQVALRFQRVDAYSPVVVLPDNILAEWKEVINTER